MRLLRDPLLYFLIAGAMIFWAYELLRPAPAQEPADRQSRTIVVDEETLLRFIAFRTKNFAPGAAKRRFDSATPAERQDLINRYIDEEVKYRTALRFGMDQDDYVIRSRLVQKVDFMGEGVESPAGQTGASDDQRLASFFDANRSRYMQPAQVTFTHVFFSAQKHSAADAWGLAQDTLQRLNQERVPFARSAAYGERFHYQLNYVERPYEDISAHFGGEMADRLFAATPSETVWLGPFQSAHGVHLVLLVGSQAAHQPALESVRDEVAADLRAAKATERRERFSTELRKAFAIEIAPRLQPTTEASQDSALPNADTSGTNSQ